MNKRRTWDLVKGFVGPTLGITGTEFWGAGDGRSEGG